MESIALQQGLLVIKKVSLCLENMQIRFFCLQNVRDIGP